MSITFNRLLVVCLFVCSSGLSAQESVLGFQPDGTGKVCSIENKLVCNFNGMLAESYKGIFALPTSDIVSHPQEEGASYPGATYFLNNFDGTAGSIAFSEDKDVIFVGGASGAYNGGGGMSDNGGELDSIAAFRIPPLLLKDDVNDRVGIKFAEQVQPWRSVFSDKNNLVKEGVDSYAHSINGMHFNHESGQLCLTVQIDYDTYPFSRANMVCFDSASDLKNAKVNGYYSVGREDMADHEAMQVAGWIADVPLGWQEKLGGKTLWGGGATGSILKRLPVGPTLYAGTLPVTSDSGSVFVNRLMAFYDNPGQQLGAYIFPDRLNDLGSWYQYELYNCDRMRSDYICGASQTDSSNVVPWKNDWWTILTYGLQGFIIPNSNTYVVIGTMEGGEKGISYKGNPDWRDVCGGPCRVGESDYHHKYWLFDLNDIVEAVNPWEIFPYEHGYLPFLDAFLTDAGSRTEVINAGFDLKTGRLALMMRARGSGALPVSDVAVFQSAAWVESFKARPRPPAVLESAFTP